MPDNQDEPAIAPLSPPGPRARALPTRFVLALWHGPIGRNLGGAVGIQLCLLVSGTISARLLGPQTRGYLALLTVWPSAVGQIGAVGMALAATYFLASKQVSGYELLHLLRRPAAIQVVALTAINAAIIMAYTGFSHAPVLLASCISLAQLPGALAADYGYAFLLGARQHGLVNILRSVTPGLYAASLVVLYVLSIHSLSIVMGCLVASILIGGLAILSAGVREARGIQLQWSIVSDLGLTEARRRLLSYGRKGYIGYLSPVDTFRIDQLIVGFLISPRALGFYAVGASFTNFARSVAYAIGLSSTPEIASHKDDAQRWAAVRRMLVLSAGLLTIITAGMAALVVFAIPILFGARFRPSIPIAELLLVAGWLLSMKRIAVDSMRGAGNAQVGTRAEIVNLVLFLICCGPLGLALGGPGVALALVVASAGGSLLLLKTLHDAGVIVRTQGR